MAQKTKRAPKSAGTTAVKLPPVDLKTRGLIVDLADEVATAAAGAAEAAGKAVFATAVADTTPASGFGPWAAAGH